MMTPADIFVVVQVCALVAWALRVWMRRRRSGLREARRSEYTAIVMRSLLASDREITQFPQIRRPWARSLLTEVLASVHTAISGFDTEVTYRTVVRYNLDGRLLRRINRTSGYGRACHLLLLGRLPIDAACAAYVARMLHSRNPYVRLPALLVQLAADPSSAIRHIAEYPHRMTALEVAEVMAMLRRGMLPLAWESLLMSRNGNLQRLGLAIVRQFGIEEAEDALWRLLDNTGDGTHSAEVLHTLCMLSHRLNFDLLRRHLAALDTCSRQTLLRFMAAEGYAASTVASLAEPTERTYYESIVESYKKVLPCP